MRNGIRYFLCFIAVLALASFALGQTETGQISGTITDSTGAVVSGAKITATSTSTGLARVAVSNSTGNYTIASLRPDTYEVAIEAPAFQRFTRQLRVTVGSSNEVSAQLNVSASSTTIEVTASGEVAAVNTENQNLSQIIDSTQVLELPTLTRNPYDFVGTAGNVTEDLGTTRGVGYTINGMRSASTNILLDGGENVNLFDTSVGQKVPLDSVQEMSVLTNNFTAEYGRASGGVVNVITKSGTNTFHGSAYEFNRVSALASNTYQNNATDTPKGVFTRNNYGFSLGGPIVKNKLFFFNNTEWIRVRSSSPVQFTIIDPASIPTLAPASQAYFKAYGTLAPGVRTLSKVPCGTLTCDTVAIAVPTDAGGGAPQNTWEEVARIDYSLSEKTTVTGSYDSYKELDFAGFVNNSPYAGYNTGQTNYDQHLTLNVTHLFGPNVVNTSKVVYNRINGPVQPLGTAPVGPTLYSSGAVPTVNGQQLVFPGYNETAPGLGLPFGGPQNLYQFYDDVSWTTGKHQFKFGGQYIHVRDNRTFGAYENAVEILGSNLNNGLANLVAGNIFQFQSAVYPQGKFPCPKDASGNVLQSPSCTLNLPVSKPAFNRNYHYNDLAFYGQDSWKLIPNFTANLGLRWEYYGVQHNANTALDSNFVLGSGNTLFDQIRNGSVKLASDGGVFWKPKYTNFGPRVGFAWDLFGNGTTSLRGGFGISYERNFGNVTFNAIQNPPNYAVLSLTSGTDVPTMPVFTDNNGPLGGTGTKALPAVSQRAINQNIKTAYAESWDLAIDRQVMKNSVLSLDYAMSYGLHLYDIANINPSFGGSAFLGDTRAANRINYQYSNQNFRSDKGYSHYNALNVKYAANNFLDKGLSLNVNYTFSHALDNLSSTFSETNGGGQSGLYQLGYLDAFNPQLNYGNADFDVRHRLTGYLMWQLPWLKNSSNGLARTIFGGWEIVPVGNVRSGSPFSIYDCTNARNGVCPEYVANAPISTSGSSTPAGSNFAGNTFNYITLPNAGGVVSNQGDALDVPKCSGLFHVGCRYSTSGLPYPERNQFRGPGFWNMDFNVYKDFKLTERVGLQFRAEFYNIFNHSNQYVATENLDVSSLADANGDPAPFVQTEKGGKFGVAGQPTDERRNLQFGLKVRF